ncbi:6-N-hydroxylaminopurine resistance protein [Salmonella enterica subsp. arizonae]|uniref:6-N-hydroxylaminopurine resistance protein n=1 Tax=Salmonella enterica subsp. arizonae TaxID=59203 RepID=A0A447RBL1_SALER|nr:6-N-hydroxylaminopurine resistance protein [Salmonella enterica subsp. arizonae]
MHYPVEVFTGKIQDYAGSRPSAIAKVQVDGELMLTELGLEGDEQAEKKIHGGPDRALCHYPREHYRYWAQEFPELAERFVAPAFGENLSTDGLTEQNVYIGDIFRWGEALIQVTQPRSPCFKLNYHFAISDMASQMQNVGKNRLALQRDSARQGSDRCAAGAGFPRERCQRAGGDRHCLAYAV